MEGRQGHFSLCQVLCRSATCWRVIKLLLTRSWRSAPFLIALFLGTSCCLFWSLKNVMVMLKSVGFKCGQAGPGCVGRRTPDLVAKRRAGELVGIIIGSSSAKSPWVNSSSFQSCKSCYCQWDFIES